MIKKEEAKLVNTGKSNAKCKMQNCDYQPTCVPCLALPSH
jgi:hypothetical protein